MGSMNWLGFSLSPQEMQPSQVEDHEPGSHRMNGYGHSDHEISSSFGLGGSDSTVPSLNHPFGFLEAFHRSTHDNQSHEWSMKEGSEISSMLMGSQDQCHHPKLENFLGNSNTTDHNHNQDDYTTLFMHPDAPHNNNPTNPNNGLNVSMIKTWLRSNPPPPPDILTNNSQTLSLTMGPAALPLLVPGGGRGGGENRESRCSLSTESSSKQCDTIISGVSNNNNMDAQSNGALVEPPAPRKSIETFGQRTSIYRGVTRHRWTGRYEAHLWDNSCRREGQTRKGRQVYLGGYDKEEKAARSYDLAALKYWGTTTTTNFPISEYEKEVEDMKNMTRQEYVASLRRKSSGFSRGASIYRGVTRHHQHGRWQARIGRVAGNKDLYLGTFSTQEEAAEAYDIAAIKFRGLNAVTNFELNRYDVKAILESTTLPIGGAAKRLKDAEELTASVADSRQQILRAINHETSNNTNSQLSIPNFHSWPGISFPQQQTTTPPHLLSMHHQSNYPSFAQRFWCKQEHEPDVGPTDGMYNGGTHNFLQMHNLMGLESNNSASTTLEHSSGSNNSIVYGSDGGFNGLHQFGNGYMENSDNNSNNNYYYSQQGNSTGEVRVAEGTYDQGWVPTAIPALGQRTNTMAVSGVPPFTVWNDT